MVYSSAEIIKGGFFHYDIPVGVLCLESYFPKPPGHVRNPLTFPFLVVCQVVEGVDVPKLLFNPTPDLLAPFIAGARQLEKDGVKAIVGSCGFMARFQAELADAVNVPFVSSSLVQIPMIRLLYGKDVRIGVLTASEKALTPAHFAPLGMTMEEVFIKGMEEFPDFWDTIITGEKPDMDMAGMRESICEAALSLQQEHDINVLLFECTDLSAFGADVQERTDLAVYDINSLVEYVGYSVCRPRYKDARNR